METRLLENKSFLAKDNVSLLTQFRDAVDVYATW